MLYAGRLTKEKGVDLLADAFLAARARDPRLELVLAGGGPEEDALRARLGGAATFLGWLEGDALARAYADSDLFLFCSQTDTFGQVVLEAQASGLPVVAVDAGGPSELIASGRSGVLCPPRTSALADAIAGLAAHPSSRRRLARAGSPRSASAPGRPLWRRSAPAGGEPCRPRRRSRGSPRGMNRVGERTRGATAARGRAPRPALRLVERRPLRVVDVALFYGERSGGIRTYLDAKAAYARRTGAFEHRLIVPGAAATSPVRLRAAVGPVATSNGYRWPIGTRPLVDLLRDLAPDVVLLHDPFWAPRAVRSVGAPVVMVHHGSIDLDATALPGPHAAISARAWAPGCAAPTRASTAS